MPTNQHDAIERDQYEKIHDLTKKVEQLTGAVDVSNQLNIKLLELLKKVLVGAFVIIVILIAALIFGAIGKDGLFAVRQSLPVPDKMPTAMIPWHNDFDRGRPLIRVS